MLEDIDENLGAEFLENAEQMTLTVGLPTPVPADGDGLKVEYSE